MKKLSKGFSADNIITVKIENETYEIANLRKSMILNQSVVLFGQGGKWNELQVSKYGASVNVSAIRDLIENKKIPYSDLGIYVNEKQNIDEFGHVDYTKLESMFPDYPYFMISKLHTHLSRHGRKSGYEDLKGFLRTLSKEPKETIPDFIARSEAQTNEIINPKYIKMETKTQQRENQLKSLGLTYVQGEDCFTGHGFTVTGNEIEHHDDDTWAELISYIEEAATETLEPPAGLTPESQAPAPAMEPKEDEGGIGLADAVADYRSNHPEPAVPAVSEPAKKPLSIEAFGRLTPERIVELQGLKEKQELVIAEHPFVAIKDKESLKKAKAAKSALLKASTSTEKIDTDAGKYLNAFKRMLSEFIAPHAKLTRAAHDKQAKEITRFEEAEKKRIEEEQAAARKKAQERTAQLVDFEFNGSVYNVGTLYILPSQIESATDEEFAALVKQGKEAKAAAEAAANAESEKDRVIRELQEKLAELTGGTTVVYAENTTTGAPPTPVYVAGQTPASVPPVQNAAPLPAPEMRGKSIITTLTSPEATKTNTAKPWVPTGVFLAAYEDNDLLIDFDLGHMEQIAADPMNTGFIKCREFYKFGLRDLSEAIIEILNAPAQEGVKKSEQILNLCEKSKL